MAGPLVINNATGVITANGVMIGSGTPPFTWDNVNGDVLANGVEIGSGASGPLLIDNPAGTVSANGAVILPSQGALTSDFASSSTTLADVPGLAYPVLAGHTYAFMFMGVFQSAAMSTGVKLALTYPAMTVGGITLAATQNSVSRQWEYWQSSTATGETANTTNPSAMLAANTDYVGVTWAQIQPSVSGTIQVQFASAVAASQAVLRTGSYGLLTEI